MTPRTIRAAVAVLTALLALSWLPVASAGDPMREARVATTTADLDIAPGELKTILTPLPLADLEVELTAWFEVVQRAAKRVASAELDAKRTAKQKKEALEEAEARKDAERATATGTPGTAGGGDPEAEVHEEHEKKETEEIATIAELHSRRTAMLDRFKIVVEAYEEKGGDAAEYEAYITAVRGVNVDTEDVGGTWKTLVAWTKSEEGGRRWLKNIGIFSGIVTGFFLLALAMGLLTRLAMGAARSWSTLLRQFVVKMVRRIVMVAGFLFALSALEIDMGPIFALVGAAGLVIGLALQGTLGNLASGIMILIYRPFDVGDLVETSGVSGKIESMNMFSTTMLTLDNQLVIVPNNSVWSGVIVNVTGSDTRRVDLVFGIGYSDDEERAVTLLEELLAGDPLVLEDPEPVVAVHELADSSVNLICRPWVKTEDYWEVYWRVTRQVKEVFDSEGITIPFPQRDVHVTLSPATAASADG